MTLAAGLLRGLIVCALLGLVAGSARSQRSVEIAMVDGDAQRSRVLTTKSVDAAPKEWLWQSERLFQLKYSVPISTQTGPMIFNDTVIYGEEFGNIVALDAHSAAQK